MNRTFALPTILALTLVVQPIVAGDRQGVTEALNAIDANWTDAQFSVDIVGISRGEAVVGQRVEIEFEAAKQGYVSYIHVSSHGDVTVTEDGRKPAGMSGTDSYALKAPLGTEQLIVLFSDKPLRSLFAGETNAVEIGADRGHAESLVRQLEQMQLAGTRIAIRKYRYTVSAAAGSTQYTTRGIIFQVENSKLAAAGGLRSATLPTRIEFEFDSDQLTDRGKRDLDEFGEALATDLSQARLVLEGHTDSVGTDEYNMQLSQRRAESARHYLVEGFGLDQGKIVAVGRGKTEPVASNDTEADRSHNRRVDFVFSVPQGAGK